MGFGWQERVHYGRCCEGDLRPALGEGAGIPPPEVLRGNRHTYGDALIPVGLPMTKRLHEMGLGLENKPLKHDPTVHRCTRGRWWLLLSISPPAPDSSAFDVGGAFKPPARRLPDEPRVMALDPGMYRHLATTYDNWSHVTTADLPWPELWKLQDRIARLGGPRRGGARRGRYGGMPYTRGRTGRRSVTRPKLRHAFTARTTRRPRAPTDLPLAPAPSRRASHLGGWGGGGVGLVGAATRGAAGGGAASGAAAVCTRGRKG